MVEPTYQPIIGVPVAWTPGTNGPVTGDAILAAVQTPADMEKFHGKLEGKIVLTVAPPELAFPTAPLATGTRRRVDGTRDRADPNRQRTRRTRRARRLARQHDVRRAPRLPAEAGLLLEGGKGRDDDPDNARGESGTLFGGGAQNRKDRRQRPAGFDHGRALQPHRAPAAARCAGEAAVRHQDRSSTPPTRFVQRDRRDPRRRQEGRARDGRRPLRFVALRHRRHRQRRRQRGRHGGDAHPEDAQPQDGPHGAHGAVGRRRRRTARVRAPT